MGISTPTPESSAYYLQSSIDMEELAREELARDASKESKNEADLNDKYNTHDASKSSLPLRTGGCGRLWVECDFECELQDRGRGEE